MAQRLVQFWQSPNWFKYALIAVAVGLAIAAVLDAPLTWDGAYYLFAILDSHEPIVAQNRIADRYLHYPVVWALEVTGSIAFTQLVFNVIHVITPLVALALSWGVVRKLAPQLMIWPMLCIGLVMLPGQINFISEGIKAEQLMWPLLLALMVNLPRRTVPMSVLLAITIYAFHPVAAPILMACGLAAIVLAILRAPYRWRLAFAGLILVAAGAYRFIGVNSGYEQSEMSWDTQSRQWSNGATGLPAVALAMSVAIAISVLLLPWLTDRWKQRLTIAQIAAIVVGIVALVIWAARPTSWWEALEFRGPAFWASMIAAGCLFLQVFISEFRGTTTMKVPRAQMFTIAIGFSLVIIVQSLSWNRVVNGLDDQMANASQACIAREDVAGYPYSPLNLWSTTALSLVIQDESPDRISMTTEECYRANQSGNVSIVSSTLDHVDGHIDLSGLRASLTQATTCTWQETAGWHQPEALIPDRWRWTGGTGDVEVTMEASGMVLMRGEFRTLVAPNTVRMFVDGSEIDSFEVTGSGSEPFAVIPLLLPAGTTTISFTSENEPGTIGTDERPLAISVWNLSIRPDDGSSPCLQIVP